MKSRILTLPGRVVLGHSAPPCAVDHTERMFDCQGWPRTGSGARAHDCYTAQSRRGQRRSCPAASVGSRHPGATWRSDDGDDGCRGGTLNPGLAVLALLPAASRSAIYARLIWALVVDDRMPATGRSCWARRSVYLVLGRSTSSPTTCRSSAGSTTSSSSSSRSTSSSTAIPAELLDEKLERPRHRSAWRSIATSPRSAG